MFSLVVPNFLYGNYGSAIHCASSALLLWVISSTASEIIRLNKFVEDILVHQHREKMED